MVSALDSRSSGPDSSLGRGHCVVFLGKTLNSNSASVNYDGNYTQTTDLHGYVRWSFPDDLINDVRFSKAPEAFRTRKVVNLCLKTDRCVSLKCLVLREPLFILRICE